MRHNVNPQIWCIFAKNMDEINNEPSNFMKYPPNSNPPKGLTNSKTLKKQFVSDGASMLSLIHI